MKPMRVNAYDESFEYIELFGKPALLTENRIQTDTIPKGWYCYDLRGSDTNPSEPVTVEVNVTVNHAGTILTHEPVTIPKSGYRSLKGRLDFLGERYSLKEFCEVRGINYPNDPRKYALRPASVSEAGLFYAMTPEKDAELGCIGHVRMDFGHGGKEFWHTWWPRSDETLNSPEFKRELGGVVDELRKTVLKDLTSMSNYCYDNGGELSKNSGQYGYVAETEHYRYWLRCNPKPGDYQAYLTCFNKRRQELLQEPPVIGKVSFASGETLAYTDPAIFLQVIRDELPYKPTSGFQYEVLTDDPTVRKGADDILYDLFGEENPRPLEDYGLTQRGRETLKNAENPNLPHSYRWFVVKNFACEGETRHDTDSLTGAIDRFNGLACDSKRLCVTKDDVATVYLAIAQDGEMHLDEGWRDNPRFVADSTVQEADARLQLSIAGLGLSGPTMTMGGM
jgi:hypothetical protein